MENIIKYSNRKMYSRASKRYVTLAYIKKQIQDGNSVTVTKWDGSDITADTLRRAVQITDAQVAELEEVIRGN